MKKPSLSALSALLVLSVAACGKTESPVQSSEVAAPTTQPTPVPGTRVVHSKVGSGKGTPMVLTANQSVSGSFAAEHGGRLEAFGVRIGNYFNSANGSLNLKLCIDGACQDAGVPLSGSKDNEYLVFRFAEPVSLAKAQTVEYTLSRSGDATNRVAVWAYPAREGQVGLTDPSGTRTNLVPRLAFHLGK
jgi:hypothetical protein